jgi:hypothetical protein
MKLSRNPNAIWQQIQRFLNYAMMKRYSASNSEVTVNDEREKLWKEAAVIYFKQVLRRNWCNSFRKVSDYGLYDRGSTPGKCKEIFFLAVCPDQPWDPASLLSTRHRESLPGGGSMPRE